MKDIAKIEREFKELERSIQRLKELERELNSLNTEGLESEANAIRSKLKDPKKVEEIEKDIEALKEKIKEREEWKKTTPGLFDTAQRLANEATKLFKGKEYDKALEKYQESLGKFVDARNGAKGLEDEGLVKAIGKDIYNVKKSIIACKKAIGVSFSENAKKLFEVGNYEDAISTYRNAIAEFEDAVKDAKEIEDSESAERIEVLIKGAEENIENCRVAIDKREVENLFKESKSLHEKAAELAKGGEMFNAKGVLRDAETKINSAFEISTKRKFSDAINKLNLLLKTIRDEMNVIDEKIASGITSVDFSRDIDKIKAVGVPEVEIVVGKEIVKEKPEIPVEAEFRRLAVGTALDKIITSAEYQMLLEEAERLKIPRERADALIQGIASEYGATIEARVGASGIEIKRGYEVLPNNDLRFGIRIINNTRYMIADVEIILDYPKTLFSLKDNIVQTLANIHPNGERTAKYTLTPLGCIHNEKIDATIVYKDHTGKKQTVQMRPKEVHCVCPFLRERAMREGEFAKLANVYEHIQEGLSFSGIGVNEIVAFVKEACAHRLYVIGEHEVDTAKIVYFAGESIGEKAYYLLTAVVQPFKNLTQVALRAYSDKPYGLHGFLNEIANSIRHLVGSVQSAKEIGVIESKQVINIIDSVVQRTSFGGIGEGAGTGATSVTIEGSVVQRTEIGSVRIRRCPNCGKEVQGDEKFCTECGARLE